LLVGSFATLLLFTIALIAVSFPVGLYTVFFTNLSRSNTASTVVPGLYIFIGPFVALLPLAGSLGGFFAGLCAVYASMIALAAKQGRRPLSALRGAFAEGLRSLFSNNLFVNVIAIGFLAFSISVIEYIESVGRIPIGGLTGDPLTLFTGLTVAPLREELGFRMLIIGVIAVFACIGKPKMTALKALWRPSAAYKEDVSSTLVQVALAVGVAISAIAFGISHVQSNSGWQIGKLPEATYAGVVLGYLYVRYGFHVAVLTHWGIDYLGSVFAFFGQGAYGIPWTPEGGFALQQVISLDLLGFFGLASFLAVAYVGLTGRLGSRKPPAP